MDVADTIIKAWGVYPIPICNVIEREKGGQKNGRCWDLGISKSAEKLVRGSLKMAQE